MSIGRIIRQSLERYCSELMDLDDSVKKSYRFFSGIEISSVGKKKQAIGFLAKN